MNLLSIWLVPKGNDLSNLSTIINDLADKYKSPVFTPHLTLFGDTKVDFQVLKSAVDEVFTNVKPFKVKSTGISQSELFFKTVFIEFNLDENLTNLFNNVSSKTDNRSIDSFKPHISLIYKMMPKEEKLKIIESLKVESEYTIGAAYIVAPKEGTDDFMDVEGWRILYKKSFT